MRIGRRRTTWRLGLLAVLTVGPAGGCNNGNLTLRPHRAGPEEDIWGVRCVRLQSANHVAVAKNYESSLKNVNGLKPELVRVFHDEQGSSVFYGRYRREYQAATNTATFKPDPLRDLERIRELSFRDAAMNQGVWPFRLANLEALPTTRIGDPKWDLENAEGHWTVHVAVFYNADEMNQRKHVAVEYCEYLREEEGVEAYYHHGPVKSSVCVGVFPKEAIEEFTREDPFSGQLSARQKVVDPRMLDLLKRFPHSLQNGHKVYTIERGPSGEVTSRIPEPSFPAMTPMAERLAPGAGPSPR